MSAAPHLQIVRDDGTHHEVQRLREELAVKDNEIGKWKRLFQSAQDEAHAEREVRLRCQKDIARLKRELVTKQAQDAEDEVVRAVFDFWNHLCKSGKAKLGAGRVKAVQARMRDEPPTSPREFMQAIIGAAYDPYVRTVDGGGIRVYNDLELICRNEVKLSDFQDRYMDLIGSVGFSDLPAWVEQQGGERARVAARRLMVLERERSARFSKDAKEAA